MSELDHDPEADVRDPDDADDEGPAAAQADDGDATDVGSATEEETGSGDARDPEANSSSRRRRLANLLLPPVLALGAVGAHYAINVPEGPVVEHSSDQGAKKESAAERRKARAEERRKKRMHQPRAGAELDTLLERYDGTDFEKEPVVGKWARQTQTMINKAIVMSRKAAFAGAPEEPRVSVVRTQCRTIRCQILLRSPYPHEVRMLANTMRRLETLAGENIWLRFDVEPGEAPGGDEEAEDTYLEVTVALIADGIESDELMIGEKAEDDSDADALGDVDESTLRDREGGHEGKKKAKGPHKRRQRDGRPGAP